jgi:hypothetical protein
METGFLPQMGALSARLEVNKVDYNRKDEAHENDGPDNGAVFQSFLGKGFFAQKNLRPPDKLRFFFFSGFGEIV